MSITGAPGRRADARSASPLVDVLTGLNALSGILLALRERDAHRARRSRVEVDLPRAPCSPRSPTRRRARSPPASRRRGSATRTRASRRTRCSARPTASSSSRSATTGSSRAFAAALGLPGARRRRSASRPTRRASRTAPSCAPRIDDRARAPAPQPTGCTRLGGRRVSRRARQQRRARRSPSPTRLGLDAGRAIDRRRRPAASSVQPANPIHLDAAPAALQRAAAAARRARRRRLARRRRPASDRIRDGQHPTTHRSAPERKEHRDAPCSTTRSASTPAHRRGARLAATGAHVRDRAHPAGHRAGLRGQALPPRTRRRARRARLPRHAPAGRGMRGRRRGRYGLVCHELEAADSGWRTFVSVQGSLAMCAISKFGSDEQKQRWLPPMARGERDRMLRAHGAERRQRPRRRCPRPPAATATTG